MYIHTHARTHYMYYLDTFEMWCWRKVEKISWTDRVENEEVLRKVKGEKISYIKYEEGRLTVFVTSCVGTACYNTLLKGI